MEKMYMIPIEIWEPRYHDVQRIGCEVLMIDPRKIVREDRDYLVLVTKGDYRGHVFEVSGEVALSCKQESNGRILCLIVPLSMCEDVTDKYNIEPFGEPYPGCAVIANEKEGYSWRVELDPNYKKYFTDYWEKGQQTCSYDPYEPC